MTVHRSARTHGRTRVQYLQYILWHYIGFINHTSMSYVSKSAKSGRILTQSRLSVVKMG